MRRRNSTAQEAHRPKSQKRGASALQNFNKQPLPAYAFVADTGAHKPKKFHSKGSEKNLFLHLNPKPSSLSFHQHSST